MPTTPAPKSSGSARPVDSGRLLAGPHPPGFATSGELTKELCEIAERLLLRGPDLAQLTADEVTRIIPAYHKVPWNQIRDQALANLQRATATLIAGCVPDPKEVSEASVADIRASQGIPLHDVLHAYRLSLALIKDELTRIGEHVDSRAVIMAIYLLWQTADVVADQLAIHHQEAEVRAARRDERHTLDTLTRILSGTINSADLPKSAAQLGLPVEGSMYVIRCSASNQDNLLAYKQHLTRHAKLKETTPPVLALIDGQLSGILRGFSTSENAPLTIGFAHIRDLQSAPEGWYAATQALTTAQAFNLSGSYSFADLALRSVITSQTSVGELLWNRYFSKFQKSDAQYELIVTTIGSLQEHGMNINQAAAAMHIHPNTLRHRLKKFESVSGCSLDDFETALEIWWAINYARSHPNRAS